MYRCLLGGRVKTVWLCLGLAISVVFGIMDLETSCLHFATSISKPIFQLDQVGRDLIERSVISGCG